MLPDPSRKQYFHQTKTSQRFLLHPNAQGVAQYAMRKSAFMADTSVVDIAMLPNQYINASYARDGAGRRQKAKAKAKAKAEAKATALQHDFVDVW